jgi:hypothetical protein
MRYFLLDEVALHNTEQDLWVIHSQCVYDVTRWYAHHKGASSAAVIRLAGQDVTRDFALPDEWAALKIGRITQKPRDLEIVNTLTQQSHVMRVCEEEPLSDILLRYIPINAHAHSYTWKYLGRVCDMAKSLSANGIAEEELFEFTPKIMLYYNDDLTIA